MAAPRTILHADMDAFYAAVEQRDDPSLKGKPVIVGGLGKRGVVSTASYEARKFGVHSALPTAIARSRCPDGIYLPVRMSVYAGVSAQIREAFEEFTPLIEPLSLDEAFLDVTGSELLFGSGEETARLLQAKVLERTRLTISIGVAASKFVAKVASDLDKPNGIVVVPPGTEVEFLAPLPVSRLWGAGKVTQGRLAALGLRTIQDVQQLSRKTLVAQFGEAFGTHFFEIANGRDLRSVVPDRGAKSISHEVTFETDLIDTDHCHAILLQLAEGVGRRLRRAELLGGTVKLKLRFPPFKTLSRQIKLATPTDDDRVIHQSAVTLFDAARSGEPVRLLGVGVANLVREHEAGQPGLFDADRGKAKRALRAMDDIRDRFGDGSIGHGGSRAE
ncbi:MAG: DNA polymerase IV [Planctomycetes bacterium]|jgi:DNA polymerase-4|nr:DNA polymerase IV [Planctomycetota bacterium]MDP6423843.1 DNA polymerase IV [Planctomycetota bacterium]